MNLYQVFIYNRKLRCNLPEYCFANDENEIKEIFKDKKVTSINKLCEKSEIKEI